MTVTVITPEKAAARPTFKKGELVTSLQGGRKNIYFVTGRGLHQDRHFAGVRLAGAGVFAEYSNEYLQDAVELFEGELVIKND